MARTWEEARESARDAAKQASLRGGREARISFNCEHYSGCTHAAEYGVGSWFSDAAALDLDFEPAGWVACEDHVILGRGDVCVPDHPRYPGGTI